MNMKIVKYVGAGIGALLAGIVIMFGATQIVYPAISQLVGLAVAQSALIWNNVADAAKGDALPSGILAESPYLYNGTTFDRQRGSITFGALVDVTRISGATTPADAYANPTTANQMWSLNGLLNGTTWDRARSASATNNTAATSLGAQQVTSLSTWSVTHTPAVATQATATKAAGGGTVRHVATSVTWCVAAGATPQAVLLINLRDGATGAGTIIRSWAVSTIASDSKCDSVSGLNMTGTANTAMTIETAAATSATVQGTVTLTGYSTP